MKKNYILSTRRLCNKMQSQRDDGAGTPTWCTAYKTKSTLWLLCTLLLTSITSWSQIALPYSETFAGITAANGFPTVTGGAWTRSGTATNQPTYITNQTSYNRTGNGDTKFMSFRYDASTRYYFVGPFALTAGTSYTASCSYKADGLTGFGPLALTYGTTAAAATHTNVIASIPANIVNTAYAPISGSFTVATDGSYYLAIRAAANGNPWYLSVDDFSLNVTPSCVSPTLLSATATSSEAVSLSWTASTSSVANYEYEIRSTGAAGSGASGLVASGSPTATTAVATGLTANTTYSVYVRTSCGGGDYSPWTAATSFATPCSAITTLPHAESFDAATLPGCWTRGGTGTWATATDSDGVPAPRTGARFAGVEWTGAAINALLVSPAYNLTANPVSTTFSVWIYRSEDGLSADRTTFFVNTTNSITGATALIDIPLVITAAPTVATAGWYKYTALIPSSFLTGGNFYIIARGTVTSSFSSYSIGFDDYKLENTPTCYSPDAFTASAITASAATISWTAPATEPANGYIYELRTSGAAGSGATGLVTSGTETGTTHSFTVLTALTSYTLYTRSDCGGGDLGTWSPFSFATRNANDDITGALPIVCGSTYTGSTATATNDQPNPAIFGVGATLSPNVWYTFTGTGTPQQIDLGLCNSGYDTSILVATGTPGNLTYIAGNEDSCGTNGFRSRVNFTSDGTTTYYIMVRGFDAASFGAYELVVACTAVCTPVAGNDECVNAAAITIGTALSTNNTCASASAQSYPTCGSQFSSYFDTWYTFNSGANTVIQLSATATAPTAVGYALYSGTCGTLTQVGCSTTGAANTITVTANTVYYVRAFSTSAAARGDFSLLIKIPCTAPTAVTQSAVTATTATITWTASASTVAAGYEYEVRTSGTAGSGATGLFTSGSTTSPTVTFNLTGLTQSTTYVVYVRSSCGGTDFSAWATRTFTTPAVCSVPTALTATPTSLSTATVSWSAPASGIPAGYEYAVTTSATPPANGTATTATSITGVSGTTDVTNYLHVRSNCDTDGFSTWATTSFYLGYCRPVTTNGCTDGDVIARVVLNTLDNNSGTGCPSGTTGYSNYTTNPSLTTTLQAGSSYNVTVYAGQYSEGYAAWIDYNDDGIFDNATERVGYSNGLVTGSGTAGVLGSSASFPVVLACNPSLGQHRLRVRAMYNLTGSSVTPCANNSYGETEDYTITISAATPCPAPHTLAATAVTPTSASLSWVVGCGESTWEIVVQSNGTGLPTGAGEVVTSNTYTAATTAGVAYEFYVRAACQVGSLYSTWAGPFNFSAPDCVVVTYPLDAATGVVVNNGVVTLDWQPAPTGGTPTSYQVYAGTTSTNTALIATVTDSQINVINLNYSSTYYWRIVPINGSLSATGCAVYSFTTQGAPANDTCAGALSLDNITSPLTATTFGYTDNYTPSCDEDGGGAADAFYSITVPAGATLVIGQTANDYDSIRSVFYGSCESPTEIACIDEPEYDNVTWVNITGSTQTVYWVQDGYFGDEGQFVLAWSVTAPCYDWTGAVSTAWATPGNWCAGLIPTATNDVTIAVAPNYPVITTGTVSVRNLTVAPGASLTVNTGATLSVAATLTTTGGTLTVQNNAALLQGSAVTANTNVGSITAVKNSNSLYRLDYTMWSSPVSGQTLGGFSSLTSAGRFYEYGVAAGAEHFIVVPETTVFEAAKGYLVRMPDTNAAAGYSAGTTAVTFVGNFTGTPNNGTVTRAASVIADRYTAVGNPYPSPISVADFFDQNTAVVDGGSALYFWRKKNNSAISSYASLNLTGFTSNQASAGNTGGQNNASFYSSSNGSWLIAQGQGFLVRTKTNPTAANITFTNSMRRAAPTSGTQSFFRTGADTMSRFWINMTDSENGFSQAMVAYSDATTLGLDYGYDGEQHVDGGRVSLYSLAADKNLSIQARPAFAPVDVVPMGFTANNAGQYTITLDRMDGLFEQGQVIYLKDNLLGITRSLATSSYSFASEAGTFNDRFEIVYATSALGTDTPTLDANTVMVYKEGSSIKINSGTAEMTGVKIFDIRGRQLYSKDGINATQTAVNGLQAAQEILIVEITTVKGKVSKRIVF